jgi:hypothetical protein
MRSQGKVESQEVASMEPIPKIPERQPAIRRGQPGGRPKDEWMVKYEVNEKGIGRILLPPSLSVLLQSDRVSITPSAGGLFIRSISE